MVVVVDFCGSGGDVVGGDWFDGCWCRGDGGWWEVGGFGKVWWLFGVIGLVLEVGVKNVVFGGVGGGGSVNLVSKCFGWVELVLFFNVVVVIVIVIIFVIWCFGYGILFVCLLFF